MNANEMKPNEKIAQFTKPTTNYMSMTEKLATDIYTFLNYEEVEEVLARQGLHIKEDKAYYEYSTLRFLKAIFGGKTKDEIEDILLRMKNIL